MKNTIKYIVLIPFVCALLYSFKPNEERLDDTIITVVKAFKEHDSITLNNLINKDIGLIFLYRTGIVDEFQKKENFDFAKPTPGYMPYFDFLTDYKIKFEPLPVFDCDSMKWSKPGLYCDTIHIDHLLSTIAQSLEDFKGEKIEDSEIEKFKEIENNSRRIVLTDKNEGELVFYLTLIENKWYLTIIDRVTSDCSA